MPILVLPVPPACLRMRLPCLYLLAPPCLHQPMPPSLPHNVSPCTPWPVHAAGEIMLYSSGYLEARDLARKLVATYK